MIDHPVVDEALGSLASTIRSTFRAMEIAEEEIEAAKRRHPAAAEASHQAFGILCPNDLIREAGERLYRAHCRELLDRVAPNAGGRQLSEPTAAELCAALSQLSLAQPISHDYVVAYGEVFRQAFPDADIDGFGDLPQSYPGRTAEVLAEVIRKIRRLCRRPAMEESR